MVCYNIITYNDFENFLLIMSKILLKLNNIMHKGAMQMKRRGTLERAIVLSLILSSGVYSTAWAEDNEIFYHGTTDNSGTGYSGTIPNKINKIDIVIDGVSNDYWADTTEAIIFNEGTYNITGAVNIINTAQNNNIDNNGAIYAKSNANITIDAGDNQVLIAAIGGSEERNSSTAISAKTPLLEFGFLDTNSVKINGNNVKIIGDLDNSQGWGINTISINISSDKSFWYGDMIDGGASCNERIEISLTDSAEWIYDQNSEIYNLTLNNGIVNLQDSDINKKYLSTVLNGYILNDYSSKNAHKSVSIESLKGNGGIFKVDLDWLENKGYKFNKYEHKNYNEIASPNSDYIFITNSEAGSVQTLDFDKTAANLDKMNVGDKLYFANVVDGNTAFTTVYGDNWVESKAGNIYDYSYNVSSETGADWYIGLDGKSAESNPNFNAAEGAMYAGYALGTELDTLNKRLGEARYLDDNDGVWVRYRHSKTGWDDTYETNSDMFQLGFDNKVAEDDGTHRRGVTIDYTDADTNIMGISGDGEHKRYAVSLYDTWLGERGHYRDLVLRGGRINSDYDVKGMFDSGYENIGGDYHQWFASLSAEWGRKNDMNNGWYFEPQVQAQLARIGGASYVSDSGISVDQDGATSLIGRAGFRIGREYVKDNGKTDNYYIKADLLHEFAGDKSFALTGNDGRYDKDYDGQETWFDIGLGADISLGKNSFFWADVERTIGADFDNTWQINGGFRWEF